jgi:hypothetical protein
MRRQVNHVFHRHFGLHCAIASIGEVFEKQQPGKQ